MMDRRSFFTNLRKEETHEAIAAPAAVAVSKEGLDPYRGKWDYQQVRHLLSRTLFGATKDDIEFFMKHSTKRSVRILLEAAPKADPPVNNYNNDMYQDPIIQPGQTWVNAVYGDGMSNGKRRSSLINWWVGLALKQDRSITQKMTLFWHNHFATEANTIDDARFLYKHHALLRDNALGNIKVLTRLITIDPAMLRYLNGYVSTKAAPDENYGRELQELFTLGKGPNSRYTEADVKAAAHVLTGWTIDRNTISSKFNPGRHDQTDKKFSAFFNNYVVKGQKGEDGAKEIDDLLDMIFNQEEVSKFLCRKLYRWFVYYNIDDQVEQNIITPLAALMRKKSYDVVPVLETLLRSKHFYDQLYIGAQIKNPFDFVVGYCRQFGVAFPDQTNIPLEYAGWENIRNYLRNMGMEAGAPPNVAGWPAYYQMPEYYRLWVNTDTLPKRVQFANNMMNGYKIQTQPIGVDLLGFVDKLGNAEDPNKLIDGLLKYLYPVATIDSQRQQMKNILLSNQVSDHYWTDAWLAYKADVNNKANKNIVMTRLKGMLSYMLGSAEYQLC